MLEHYGGNAERHGLDGGSARGLRRGFRLRFGGSTTASRWPTCRRLQGRHVRQTEIVRDAPPGRPGDPILFDVSDVRSTGAHRPPGNPYRHEGRDHVLQCDVIAGCDGFHGVCRPSIPADVLTTYSRDYPFAWLGILADVEPSTFELLYGAHENGFALHSMRSSKVSRFYRRCDRTESRRVAGRARLEG
jgi:p-hydroxybenzoate 3-monooxygenase